MVHSARKDVQSSRGPPLSATLRKSGVSDGAGAGANERRNAQRSGTPKTRSSARALPSFSIAALSAISRSFAMRSG